MSGEHCIKPDVTATLDVGMRMSKWDRRAFVALSVSGTLGFFSMVSCEVRDRDIPRTFAGIGQDSCGYVVRVDGDSISVVQVFAGEDGRFDGHSVVARYLCNARAAGEPGVMACRSPGMPIVKRRISMDAPGRFLLGVDTLWAVEDSMNCWRSDPARVLSDLKPGPASKGSVRDRSAP